jgi:Fe-S cluster biogenesis protein NfuA
MRALTTSYNKGVAQGQELRITAEPHPSGQSCRFVLEKELYPGAAAVFESADSARGSPLAEMIFGVEGVRRLAVTPNTISVTIERPEADWRARARQIAQVIRAHYASGQPAVADDKKGNPARDIQIGQKVQAILDEEINPGVAAHGGFVTLLDVKNSQVYLQLGGGCQGCGMADVTLKYGIETILRERVPEVVGVVDQTDHAGGTNPYYSPGK